MPRDPQGAGTRTETTYRAVYRHPSGKEVLGDEWETRDFAANVGSGGNYPIIAIERIETTTTITREHIAPHAGEETKG